MLLFASAFTTFSFLVSIPFKSSITCLSTFIIFVMASQASFNAEISADASQGAGSSDISPSLSTSAQGSTEQKPAGPSSPLISNSPLKAPGKESSSNAGAPFATDSRNALQSQNEDQIPQDLIEPRSARQPSLPVSATSGRAASIQSVGDKDVSAATDSYSALGSNEKSQTPPTLLNQNTRSQSSLPFSPGQFEDTPVNLSGSGNFPDATDFNGIPVDAVEGLQKPQELPQSGTPSQPSLPISPHSETEGVKWLNNANGRKDTEIPGSWPVPSETSPMTQDWQPSETPNHSFLPLSHISSGIDEVKAPSHADTPVASNLPNISKSPKPSLLSISSSSLLSKTSDQEIVRALEPGTGGRTDLTRSIPTAVDEELTPPHDVESRVLTSLPGSSTYKSLMVSEQ